MTPGFLEYVKDTFRPWTSSGVHLIFITPKDQMTPEELNKTSVQHAERLHAMCVPVTSPADAEKEKAETADFLADGHPVE